MTTSEGEATIIAAFNEGRVRAMPDYHVATVHVKDGGLPLILIQFGESPYYALTPQDAICLLEQIARAYAAIPTPGGAK